MLFRPVPGYADLYAGMDSTIIHAQRGQLVAKPKGGNGYLYVYIPGVGTRFVHQLVAAAYLGVRQTGMQTRHADSDKANSAVGNLCYGTASNNTWDAIDFGRHGACTNKAKTHCPKGHRFSPANTLVTANGFRQCRTCNTNYGNEIESRCREAARLNGQGLTTEQKNARVDALVREFPALPNREIAGRAGVSHTTVRRRRAALLVKG